jgi:hypothetical protein
MVVEWKRPAHSLIGSRCSKPSRGILVLKDIQLHLDFLSHECPHVTTSR